MTAQSSSATQVLIAGAGPTGLTMAYELARRGIACRLVDKAPAVTDKSKALAIHARTLEVFENMGIVEDFLSQGLKVHALNLHLNRQPALRVSLNDIDTPYPFILTLPQSETESILQRHVENSGIKVERNTELISFQDSGDLITATLKLNNGQEEICTASWLIGCDGAHSTVRHMLQLPFEGTAYEETFGLADVAVAWSESNDGAHMFLDPHGILAFFPFKGGRHRIIVALPKNVSPPAEPLLEDFQKLVNERGPSGTVLSDPHWLAWFKIHRRAVKQYRKNRVFLAGDAAHIHSPAGGQGMNTGIQDAYNLAWKLALEIQGAASSSLLDSYATERHQVAQAVLRGTDLMTRFATTSNPIVQHARNFLAPILLSQKSIQKRLFKAVSEIDINYRQSPIVNQVFMPPTMVAKSMPEYARLSDLDLDRESMYHSSLSAGDRAPDVTVLTAYTSADWRLFELLKGTKHTLLIFSGMHPQEAACTAISEIVQRVTEKYSQYIDLYIVLPNDSLLTKFEKNIPTLLDRNQQCHSTYHAQCTCLYLIRPDGYIGYRALPALPKPFEKYLQTIFK